MKNRRIAGAVLAIIVLAGTAAATDRAVRAEHIRLQREGYRLAVREQYSAALTRFERALAYRVTPFTLWNLAMSHLELGHRDMTLWFMERYLAEVQTARESLEVQQAVTAIAVMDEWIPPDECSPLGDQLTAAVEAAAESEATPADPTQQVYGTGLVHPIANVRSELAHDYGTMLFRSGIDQIHDNNWDNGRVFFERSLAYRTLRNAAYNIASIQLDAGRRDLAVHFYRLYITNQPAVQGHAGVAAALQAIEDAPPRVGNQARRNELSDQMDRAIQNVLDGTPTSVAGPAQGPTATDE